MTATSIVRNIVLDIDGVISGPHLSAKYDPLFFLRKGHILIALKTHYIFPATIEFLQFLYRQPNIRVSFFSSGSKERNRLLVNQLLQKTLLKEAYEKMEPETAILSKEDLIENRDEDTKTDTPYYPGPKQKDLSKVLRPGESIEDALLIEDNSHYATVGQYKNLLKVDETELWDFFLETEVCTPDGYRPIPSFLLEELTLPEQAAIRAGEYIAVLDHKTIPKIAFCDQGGFLTIVPIQNPLLLNALKNLENKTGVKALQDEIHAEVELQGGKIKRVFHEANRIYYIAGLIFTVLERSAQTKSSLSETLYQIQFPNREFKKLEFQDDSLYELGLKKLKEINPSLDFISPLTHKDLVPPTEEERRILDDAIKNQSNDCVLM